MVEKWGPISNFLLENTKNLQALYVDEIAEDFDGTPFLLSLLEKHRHTLQEMSFRGNSILDLPQISLPLLEEFSLVMLRSNGTQIERFQNLIEKILQVSENLEVIKIYDVDETPQIAHFIENT